MISHPPPHGPLSQLIVLFVLFSTVTFGVAFKSISPCAEYNSLTSKFVSVLFHAATLLICDTAYGLLSSDGLAQSGENAIPSRYNSNSEMSPNVCVIVTFMSCPL